MALSPGTRLGPYEIVALIGAGGMGEVYRATDTRLGRVVAVKVLHGTHNERFEREARAIAALNHPHICTLHDVGPNYLVMEYVEGAPLRGPLPVEETLRLALQMAAALEAAHGKGITHRDLKPGNILVNKEGVKLLDFGLAKMAPAPGENDPTLTQAGTVLGTAAYMSPEQAEGRTSDARSDVFSFGLVLYETLTGRRAFEGENAISTMGAILHKEPRPLQAPPALERIVMRCLEKKPAQRFQTMAELKETLEAVRQGLAPPQSQPSIAVLPFANMSRDEDNEYFSDGLAEEIINLLTRIPGLKVIARTSAFAFKGKHEDIRRIAEALGVATVLEGSVRKAGNRLRVTAQLISASDGSHLWSERYDREMTDVFAMQDEIAAAIAGALQLKFSPQPAARARHTPSLPAYEAYLKGAHYMFKHTPEALARAKEYLEQAMALDPEYALPHSTLGVCYYLRVIGGLLPAHEAMPLIRRAEQKALDLDSSLPEAHSTLAVVAASYDYDWKEAERRFRLAMTAVPVSSLVRMQYALLHLLPFGRAREAVEEMELALEQDPLNVMFRNNLANVLNAAGMPERGIAEARKVLEIDENYWFAYFVMGIIYAPGGMIPEALAAAEKAYQLAPWNPVVTGLLAGTLVRAGDSQRAEGLVQRLREAPAMAMVYYHLLCSEVDAAADSFEKAIEQRHPMLAPLLGHPITRPLRTSPRWPALMRMMNLPETT
jgi:TolB-like protein/predicted Ser/Thr protein kinase